LFIKVQNAAQARAATETFAHLHSLSLSYHIHRRTGGVMRGIDRGTRALNFLTSFLVFNILPTLSELVLVCFILVTNYIAWTAVIVFVLVVAYVGFTVGTTEYRSKLRRELNMADNDTNDKAVDSLLNFETVKYFNAEQMEIDRYGKSLDNYNKQAQKLQRVAAVVGLGQSFIVAIGQLSILILAAKQVQAGKMTVGDFVLVNTYFLQLHGPLNTLGVSYRMIKQSFIDLESMFDILDTKPEIVDAPDAIEFTPPSGAITFENVHFKYNDDREVLKGISFRVPSGKQLAVVGPSGGGKTTINRLLFRFYEPTDGRILIDGVDVKTMKQHDLRASIGMVPQDTVLFNDTIRYNIQYGDMQASDSEIHEAAETAQIAKKIEEFPQGWDTRVGERGLRLSGGEKQRVAIARSVLKGSKIMVFDEATASLDTHTEREIQDNLRHAFKGNTTTIVLAHRLSTIVDSDEIIVLKNGEIVERGTHDELLQLQGEYSILWKKQSNMAERKKEEHIIDIEEL
jgi:ATP-binding cassette subfamily B protein